MESNWVAEVTGARTVERGERIQSLWSGYGELYRARVDGRPVVVKSVRPPPGDSASHRRKVRSYEVELAFYQRYAPRARVPRWIAGGRRDERVLLVLEDLDAAGYAGRRRRAIDACLQWLATFHAQYLGVEPDGLWPVGTYWHLDTRRDELAAIADPALRDAAPVLDARLRAARYRTIVHGDAKVANFCFADRHGGSVAAVDFQYTGGGCGMSDVAYFLACFDEVDVAAHLDTYFRHLNRPDVEREWRGLFPIAAADFYRFYAGWAPTRWPSDHHGQQIVARVLRML